MIVRFEELTAAQRTGGIETATHGLEMNLREMGIHVHRGSNHDPFPLITGPDCVHLHGIWSPILAKRWRYWKARSTPCVVSPHGMLEPWAFAHKRLKKKVAWVLYQRFILNRVAGLHATSEQEAGNLRSLGLKSRIETIPWGIDIHERLRTVVEAGNSQRIRTALFVGRIYPVKGLPLLINAWAKVKPTGWKMKIVGPDEAGHLAVVKALIRQLSLESCFEFSGTLSGVQLQQAYEDADLFILPSHTENFGMVVGEALANCLPVITTKGAPWSGIETHRCGWWSPISADGIATALTEATSIDDTRRRQMGERGREWIANDFSWQSIAKRMINFYNLIIRSEKA